MVMTLENNNLEDDPYGTQRMFDTLRWLYGKEQVTTPPQHQQFQQQQVLDQHQQIIQQL